MNYIVSPLAEADLDGIWLYIAEDNPAAADRMIRKIFKSIAQITKTPFIGRTREELLPHIRSLSVTPYIIFYRPLPKVIEIVRVLHGARDIDEIFN